jgi:hypothetical protein
MRGVKPATMTERNPLFKTQPSLYLWNSWLLWLMQQWFLVNRWVHQRPSIFLERGACPFSSRIRCRVHAARVEYCCWAVIEYWRERCDTCGRVRVPVEGSDPVDSYEPVDCSYLHAGYGRSTSPSYTISPVNTLRGNRRHSDARPYHLELLGVIVGEVAIIPTPYPERECAVSTEVVVAQTTARGRDVWN